MADCGATGGAADPLQPESGHAEAVAAVVADDVTAADGGGTDPEATDEVTVADPDGAGDAGVESLWRIKIHTRPAATRTTTAAAAIHGASTFRRVSELFSLKDFAPFTRVPMCEGMWWAGDTTARPPMPSRCCYQVVIPRAPKMAPLAVRNTPATRVMAAPEPPSN